MERVERDPLKSGRKERTERTCGHIPEEIKIAKSPEDHRESWGRPQRGDNRAGLLSDGKGGKVQRLRSGDGGDRAVGQACNF
jgi:hypothetical protein